MNLVEQTGGIPKATKKVTILSASWKNLSDLGCVMSYDNKNISYAVLRVPEGKQIEMSTDSSAASGDGFMLDDGYVFEMNSSQEINTIYFRALGGEDVDIVVILSTSQVG